MEQKEYGKISLAPECPECGSSNVFDLGSKCECEDCGETWTKKAENNRQNLINNLTRLYLPTMGLTGIDGMIIVLCFRWGLSETCKTTDKTI